MPHAPGRPRALRILAAAALAAAALAGCGGGDGEPAASAGGATGASAPAAEALTAPAPAAAPQGDGPAAPAPGGEVLTAPTPRGEEALPETTPEGAPPGIDDSGLPSGGQVVVGLGRDGGAGPGGTATFIPLGEGLTRVVVRLEDPVAEPRPAHLHRGTCGAPEPTPVHALTDLAAGASETFVTASLAELRAAPLAVDVHPPGAGEAPYVACGELPAP